VLALCATLVVLTQLFKINTLLFIESGFTKPSLTNEVELSLSLSLHDILWFLVDGDTVGPDCQVSIANS